MILEWYGGRYYEKSATTATGKKSEPGGDTKADASSMLSTNPSNKLTIFEVGQSFEDDVHFSHCFCCCGVSAFL
jgi:hypothetical protein